MTPTTTGAGLALAACLIVGVTACTQEGVAAPPAPPPATATVSPTPTEDPQYRQRHQDMADAEHAYLAAFAEQYRLYLAGGATKPTKVLTDNTTGQYLKFTMENLRSAKKRGWHASQPAKAKVGATSGWSEKEIDLTACEDSRRSRVLDKHGNDVTPKGSRMFVQSLQVRKIGGRWKVADTTSERVTTFENTVCTRIEDN